MSLISRARYVKGRIAKLRARRIEDHKRIVARRKQLKRIRAKQRKAAAGGLRGRALDEARHLIGVTEQGGNNVGPTVTAIIRENGGTGPEPWCGDFVAHCYRKAGSKAVTRAWAAVALYLGVGGIRQTSSPKPGDPVRYTFSHIGLFEKDNGNGTITTIEGNTGSSGAVSDSHSGTDGVKRKIRSKSLVRDYLEVTR